MGDPALLTGHANCSQPLLLPRPQLPLTWDKGLDSGESKGPASSDIPGFLLFYSALNSLSSPIFPDCKTEVQKRPTLQFLSPLFFCFVLFFIFLPFLGPLPRHMEVPRLGV